MNPLQLLMNQLQTQIKMKNPQLYQKFQSLVKNTNDPKEFLHQLTSNYTPEQKENFVKFANSYGVSQEQLNKFDIN